MDRERLAERDRERGRHGGRQTCIEKGKGTKMLVQRDIERNRERERDRQTDRQIETMREIL